MITAERPLGQFAPCAVQPVFAWLLILTLPLFCQEPRTTAPRASIAIDAGKPAGTISPLVYGQFLIKRHPRRLACHPPPQPWRLDPVSRAGMTSTTWLSSKRRGNFRWQTA